MLNIFFSLWSIHITQVKTELLLLNPLPICAIAFFNYTTWGNICGSVDSHFWEKCNCKQQFIKTATLKLMSRIT